MLCFYGFCVLSCYEWTGSMFRCVFYIVSRVLNIWDRFFFLVFVMWLGVQKERMLPEDMYVLSPTGTVLSSPSPKPYPNKPPKCSDCGPLFMKVPVVILYINRCKISYYYFWFDKPLRIPYSSEMVYLQIYYWSASEMIWQHLFWQYGNTLATRMGVILLIHLVLLDIVCSSHV